MSIGTFPKIGSGNSPDDGIRPNFTTLGYDPAIWEFVSETSTTMTVSYQTQ